jgi:hypothetical protein
VAQFSLRVIENESGSTRFSIENMTAQDAAGQPVPVVAPLPSVIAVTP